MDTETALLGALIAFVAAVTQAITGFAFALVFAPLFALAWEPKPAVAATVVLSVVVNVLVLVLLQVRGHINYGRLPGMYGGYLLGVGPGLLFLDLVSGEVLQITLGVVVIAAALVLYARPTIDPGHDSMIARVVAGAASGASASATGIGRPPVVLYMLGRELDIHRFRATLQAYFLPISCFTLTSSSSSAASTKMCSSRVPQPRRQSPPAFSSALGFAVASKRSCSAASSSVFSS